jgi:hypothetical protein
MAYTDTCVEIRFINDMSNSSSDDKIVIRRDLYEGFYDLVYTDNNNGKPITFNLTTDKRGDIMQYMYLLFKNQSLDEEAPCKVQVNIPSMPRVIVSGDKFQGLYYREHFSELIDSGLDFMDNSFKIRPTKKTH